MATTTSTNPATTTTGLTTTSLTSPTTTTTSGSSVFSDVEECLRVYKEGGMVIVMDDENRENEGDLIMAAQCVTEQKVAFIIRHTTGILCTAMPKEWADVLGLPLMVSVNTDPNGTAFTVTCDHVDAGTGVSATHRALTIRALADPSTQSGHLRRPGHIFPLIARPGGVLQRRGHTEAAVDLCKLTGLRPVGLLSELCNDDGTMMRLDDCVRFASEHGRIPIMSIEGLVQYIGKMEVKSKEGITLPLPPQRELSSRCTVEQVAQCEIPIQFDKNTYLGIWQLRIFVSHHDRCQHVVLIKGDISQHNRTTNTANTGTHSNPEVSVESPTPGDSRAPPDSILTRIHSECFTGNTLGSIRCDCGPQLQQSMEIIALEGRGIVLYVAGHEGRGIGLINKIKAYEVQTKDLLDTYQANTALGFPSDVRDYSPCLAILDVLGVSKISLLTSNPEKMHAFKHLTTHVTPLICEPNEHNQAYFKAKQQHNAERRKILNIPSLSASEPVRKEKIITSSIEVRNDNVSSHVGHEAGHASSSNTVPGSHEATVDPYGEISVPVPDRARNIRISIIHTSWNKSLVQPLVEGCVRTLCDAGVLPGNVQVIDVPGSFELPLATQMVAQRQGVDAILCVGVLIKGETMHFEYLSESVVHGLMKVQLKTGVPVINGVLNCLTFSQAEQRCVGPNNLSQSLAYSALRMASLRHSFATLQPPSQTFQARVFQPCTDTNPIITSPLFGVNTTTPYSTSSSSIFGGNDTYQKHGVSSFGGNTDDCVSFSGKSNYTVNFNQSSLM